jgi:hypothetical protein
MVYICLYIYIFICIHVLEFTQSPRPSIMYIDIYNVEYGVYMIYIWKVEGSE